MKRFFKSLLLGLVVIALPLSLVACRKDSGNKTEATCPTSLKDAKSYIESKLVKSGETLAVSKCTKLPTILAGGITFTWTVSGCESALATIEDSTTAGTKDLAVNSFPDNDFTFTLNCKIAKESDNWTLSWNFNVAKFVPMTYAQVTACSKDGAVSFEGVVTQVVSKTLNNASENDLFIQNTDGAVMGYKLSEDPADKGVEIGKTVQIKGTYSPYNGLAEIANATYRVLSTEKATVTPTDVTSIVAAATGNTDSTLTALVGKYVEIKNVTVTDENTNSGYYNFELGNVKSYVRLSSSQKAITEAETTTFKAGHAEHECYLANVSGIVNLYSGAFYLTPCNVNAFTYLSLPTKTDAEAAAYEKEILATTTRISAAGTVDLRNVGKIYKDQVTSITWASSNEDIATISTVEGVTKVTYVMPVVTTSLKLTATITAGSTVLTKDFDVLAFVAVDGLIDINSGAVGEKGYSNYETNLGVQLSLTEVCSNTTSGYLQFRSKDGKTSEIKSTTATANGIKKIVMNYNSGKTMSEANKSITILLSETADFASPETIKVNFEADKFVYIVEPTDTTKTYKYFDIKYTASSYTQYWDSIQVYTGEPKTASMPATLSCNDIFPVTIKVTKGIYITNEDVLTFESSDTTVASVDQTGKITGLKAGKCFISLKLGEKVLARTTLTVNKMEGITGLGTAASPFTVEDAVTIFAEQKDLTEAKYYVQGVITSSTLSKGQYNLVLKSSAQGTKSFTVYWGELVTTLASEVIGVGDEIVAYGCVKAFTSNDVLTVEFAKANDVAPSITSIVSRGNGTAKVKDGLTGATVTFNKTSGLNGTEFTFTVTPDAGKKVDSVKINNVELTAVSGVYSSKFAGSVEVVVYVSNASELTDTITYSGITSNTTMDKVSVSNIGLDSTIFTMTYEKGTPGTSMAVRTDGFRMYGVNSSADGNKLTISVKQGYTIKSINIEIDSAEYGLSLKVYDSNNAIVTGTEGVYNVNSSSFKLVCDNTNYSSYKQARFQSIIITYTANQTA